MRRHARFWVVASVVAAVVSLTVALYVFTGRRSFDDEGYMLVSLRGWMSGHALYNDVFTQYGPAFFVIVGGPLRLIGFTQVSIEAARAATVVLALITAGTLGFATSRIAGSRYAGLFAAAVVGVCSAAGFEAALHPTHVVQALIGCTLAAVVVLDDRPDSRAAAIATGIAVALCVLVKVNAGGVVLVGVAAGTRVFGRGRNTAVRFVAPLLVVAAIAAAAARSGYPSHFLVLVGVAGVVVLLAVWGRDVDDGLPFTRAAVAFVVTAVVVVAIALATGTTVTMLVKGVIIEPTGLARAFMGAMEGGRYTLVPLAVIGGAAWVVRRNSTGVVTGAILVTLGLCAAAVAYNQRFSAGTAHGMNTMVLGAATGWTILVHGERRFASSRVVVAALALLLPLTVYPVAGGQRTAASILFPVVGAISIARGARLVADAGVVDFARAVPVLFSALALAVGGVALVKAHRARVGTVAIPFTGRLARTTPDDARDITAVVAALDQCDTFFSLPGVNSFYAFANKKPPTWQNAGAWTNLFDASRQRRVVRDLRRAQGLCVIRNRTIEEFWTSGGDEQKGPLRPFVESKRIPVATVGDYEIYR